MKFYLGLLALFLISIHPAGAQTGDIYTDKLKSGDAKMAAGDFSGASSDFGSAVGDAQTPTQSALALGKKAQALLLAKDFGLAREAAKEALSASEMLEPVAKVTALEALAKCQLESKDYAGAIETLLQADKLTGVDWAKANLAMIRGDAERGSGSYDAAVAAYRSVLEASGASDGMKGVAWLNIGLTEQYSLNSADKAKEAYAKAVALNPALKTELDAHLARLAP